MKLLILSWFDSQVCGNLRIIIQNLHKYGLLVVSSQRPAVEEPVIFFAGNLKFCLLKDLRAATTMIHDPWFIYTLGINVNIIISYLIEYPASSGRWPAFFMTLHFMNAIATFAVPWAGSTIISL